MSAEIERAAWSGYFKGYNERNEARPTRLQIFGDLGAQEAEHNLPFSGITLEDGGHDAPKLQIMLGNGTPADMSHLTHTVTRVTRITPKQAADGGDEALEIEDDAGVHTLLSFTGQAEFLPAT
jgi:Family of unknown function (DUF5335)